MKVGLDVVDVMIVQGLLEVDERCFEGIEEVTNPSDIEYDIHDVLRSFDDVVVELDDDWAPLSLDV